MITFIENTRKLFNMSIKSMMAGWEAWPSWGEWWDRWEKKEWEKEQKNQLTLEELNRIIQWWIDSTEIDRINEYKGKATEEAREGMNEILWDWEFETANINEYKKFATLYNKFTSGKKIPEDFINLITELTGKAISHKKFKWVTIKDGKITLKYNREKEKYEEWSGTFFYDIEQQDGDWLELPEEYKKSEERSEVDSNILEDLLDRKNIAKDFVKKMNQEIAEKNQELLEELSKEMNSIKASSTESLDYSIDDLKELPNKTLIIKQKIDELKEASKGPETEKAFNALMQTYQKKLTNIFKSLVKELKTDFDKTMPTAMKIIKNIPSGIQWPIFIESGYSEFLSQIKQKRDKVILPEKWEKTKLQEWIQEFKWIKKWDKITAKKWDKLTLYDTPYLLNKNREYKNKHTFATIKGKEQLEVTDIVKENNQTRIKVKIVTETPENKWRELFIYALNKNLSLTFDKADKSEPPIAHDERASKGPDLISIDNRVKIFLNTADKFVGLNWKPLNKFNISKAKEVLGELTNLLYRAGDKWISPEMNKQILSKRDKLKILIEKYERLPQAKTELEKRINKFLNDDIFKWTRINRFNIYEAKIHLEEWNYLLSKANWKVNIDKYRELLRWTDKLRDSINKYEMSIGYSEQKENLDSPKGIIDPTENAAKDMRRNNKHMQEAMRVQEQNPLYVPEITYLKWNTKYKVLDSTIIKSALNSKHRSTHTIGYYSDKWDKELNNKDRNILMKRLSWWKVSIELDDSTGIVQYDYKITIDLSKARTDKQKEDLIRENIPKLIEKYNKGNTPKKERKRHKEKIETKQPLPPILTFPRWKNTIDLSKYEWTTVTLYKIIKTAAWEKINNPERETYLKKEGNQINIYAKYPSLLKNNGEKIWVLTNSIWSTVSWDLIKQKIKKIQEEQEQKKITLEQQIDKNLG